MIAIKNKLLTCSFLRSTLELVMTTAKQKEKETREWLKYQLRSKGISLASIGRELHISRQAVAQALLNPHSKTGRYILARLGISESAIEIRATFARGGSSL